MKLLTKIIACITAFAITAVSLCSCSAKKDNRNTRQSAQQGAVKEIRFLNFKPEIAMKYEQIAKVYESETGIKVTIETAANNTYEQTLSAKIATSEAPAIFQINGPTGYANWKDYCADLSGTEIYKHLTDKSMAVSTDGGVWGIPYVVEGYGIIYNSEITDKYFELENRAAPYKSMDEIKSFKALKAICDDMQKNASLLGIEGVFSSTSLKSGEDWRWQTHLANIPFYYEFEKSKTDIWSSGADEIKFEFQENFKNIFDLYITDSVSDRKTLGKKIVDESMAEFATGKSAMVQNGNWAYEQISKVEGNTVDEDDIKFLPVYTGIDGEENQGLCIGTENFLAINSKLSEAEQKAAADFIYWLFSSEKGKSFVVDELSFIAPFDTFSEDETPDDPLAKEVVRWMKKDGIKNIPWSFTAFPSQKFKEDFGSALLRYAQGTITWNEVVTTVVDKWKTERQASEK